MTIALALLASCKYDKVADGTYPDQKIYFPAAREGNRFVVNAVPEANKPYRFEIKDNKFKIPLSVYRGGVTTDGSFTAGITVDNDTVNSLITNGVLLTTELLPANQYTVTNSVTVGSGEDGAPFDLSINLEYLLANLTMQKAVCLRLAGSGVTTSATLNKVIIILNPAILIPTAAFNTSIVDGNPKNLRFNNTSANGVKYSWNFGDGGTSTEKSPAHLYAAAGTYTVTLVTEGVTGEAQKATLTTTVTVP